jgi:hypothetical protein
MVQVARKEEASMELAETHGRVGIFRYGKSRYIWQGRNVHVRKRAELKMPVQKISASKMHVTGAFQLTALQFQGC